MYKENYVGKVFFICLGLLIAFSGNLMCMYATANQYEFLIRSTLSELAGADADVSRLKKSGSEAAVIARAEKRRDGLVKECLSFKHEGEISFLHVLCLRGHFCYGAPRCFRVNPELFFDYDPEKTQEALLICDPRGCMRGTPMHSACKGLRGGSLHSILPFPTSSIACYTCQNCRF